VITSFNVENLFDLVTSTNDVFGQIGVDPGSGWGSGSTSAKNHTLRRKDYICQGDNNGTDQFDPVNEWDGFAEDTFDDLGSYTTSCPSTLGLLISEYIEGSSNNKAIEIYNGTGIPIDLEYEAYAIDFYFNGYSTPFVTIPLTGVIASDDVFVLADHEADPAILAVADQTSTKSFFNGDDVIVLRKGNKDDASSTPTPEQLETQLAKLALAIEVELELPEIIVLQEIENQAIAQVLGDRVNAAAGTNYQAVSFETSDARGIEAGFLWDADRIDLLDAFQLAGPDVEAAFGPSSPSPGREPIVGLFKYKGKEFTIVGNHFKSKGGDDAIFSVTWPPTRITEVQRKAQAQVVRDYVDTILDPDPDALVMVAGDLNDFQFGEPGEGPDHPLAILEGYGGGEPLTNLINLEKDDERFTYIYDGNSQVLDHMLVSPAFMSRLMGTDVLHFNAGYRSSLGSDPSTTLRASDHDPVEGRFSFKK
jgi:predicted extracellular nuclease